MRTINICCAIAAGVFLAAPVPAGAVGPTSIDNAAVFKSERAELRLAAECFTDEGYGRRRPCGAGGGYYKKSNKKKPKIAK